MSANGVRAACDNPGMSKPFIILSHGLESGPDATKVSALAREATALGCDSVRPDFRDLDASRDVRRIDERVARIVAHVPAGRRVVLAGSSMGAFTSALASLEIDCIGLFLIALPVAIPGYERAFDARRVPTARSRSRVRAATRSRWSTTITGSALMSISLRSSSVSGLRH
jgi:pimeloyl-ACP methyl ester carboxylesterase